MLDFLRIKWILFVVYIKHDQPFNILQNRIKVKYLSKEKKLVSIANIKNK